MSMLAFMPWLRLQKSLRVGPFHLFPQGLGDTLPEGIASDVELATLHIVLGQYHGAANLPLQVVTVLQYDDRPIGGDLDEAERAAIFRFASSVAVSGMGARRFIGGFADDYTATGHYQVIIQAFSEPYKGGVNLTFRRKGGHAQVMMHQTNVKFVLPAHLVSQGQPNVDLL